MAAKKNDVVVSPQPENKYDQKSEAPKSGHSGLEPDVESATQGVRDYDLDDMRESPTRSGLQPRGTKPFDTAKHKPQLGGGRSIDLEGRPNL